MSSIVAIFAGERRFFPTFVLPVIIQPTFGPINLDTIWTRIWRTGGTSEPYKMENSNYFNEIIGIDRFIARVDKKHVTTLIVINIEVVREVSKICKLSKSRQVQFTKNGK